MSGERDRRAGALGPTPTECNLGEDVVEFASGVLDADVCEFLVEAGDRLVVRAASGDPAVEGDRSYPLWRSIPGQSYSTGRACVIDDCLDVRSATTTAPASAGPGREHRSLCCAPIDGWGLLVWKALAPGAFADADRDRAEQIAEAIRIGLDAAAGRLPAVPDGGNRDGRDEADLLKEIADILSHDLKNPLNVAKGNLELARESAVDRHIEQASKALDRIEALVDELVILARTGHRVEQLETVELARCARTAWDHIHTADATLEVEPSPAFNASERGVTHLLENLFENAVTHADPAATVRIGGLVDGFYVEDDGPGIPPDHRDRIFDRGYAVDPGTSGLGLHIAKRIAEAHGWDIDVTDASAGGARFEVTGVDIERE